MPILPHIAYEQSASSRAVAFLRSGVGGNRLPSSIGGSSAVFAKLLTLDSVFYQPHHWKSWYVKKLTRNLSIQDSIQRRKTSGGGGGGSSRSSSSEMNVPPVEYSYSPIQLRKSRYRPSAMIKTMHQFSTIKTSYSDQLKSFVSDPCPQRPMLVQVEFEVFGEVSGSFPLKLLFFLIDILCGKSQAEQVNIGPQWK